MMIGKGAQMSPDAQKKYGRSASTGFVDTTKKKT